MTHKILFILFGCFLYSNVQAQKQLYVAFYNQENLFDTIDDPHKNDNEFLPTSKNGWNTEKYINKINHMAMVIASMNNGSGADILGMCEVENAAVLSDLTKSEPLTKMHYSFVHFESPDERSIDNALLYQAQKFKLLASMAIPVVFAENPRSKTRDILVVKLLNTKTKKPLFVLVNHFPSRLGGEAESAPKRINAAKILRSIYDSISKADPNTPVIMMGDFNDEPNDESIEVILGAKGKVETLQGNDLFNPMYAMQEQKNGSHFYRGNWGSLDQIIISNNLVNCKLKWCYKMSSASVYKQDWMLESTGKYAGTPKRTFAGPKYLNGYSDHLPVFIILETKK